LSQIFLVFTFVFISGTELKDIRISIINDLLNVYIINFVFVSFCILIIINGFNFIDGLNTLSLGYVLSILLIVLYLHYSSEIMINIEFIINLLIVLIPIFFLNLLNKLYLGDNGSYLLGFLVSIILINVFNENNYISPYFIVLLLWYPGFENLFSIIRKSNYKKSPLSADNNHLHQKIFIFIKKKYLFSNYISNILSANIIVFYNFLIFCLASNFIKSTYVQIILIFLNIMIYLFIYNKLKNFN
jgi:UDP-N-acetylmuramyl pentapeptide phosphotransferase/UDP-N-acetylglucosamine-1-phosphate transferase